MDDFATGKNTTALPPGMTTFDWNTKVKDIMPAGSGWDLMDKWAYEKANIRDILSHVSGIPRFVLLVLSHGCAATILMPMD
jgi:CubicO group peptidase (beta-lactamase class C family)